MYHYSTDTVESVDISEVVKAKPTPSGILLIKDTKNDAHSKTGIYSLGNSYQPEY